MATSRSKVKSSPPNEPSELSPSLHGWERIHGHLIYWEIHGPQAGVPVVLLHHGLGSTRSWRRQLPAFIAAGMRILVYDRWGFGRSDKRPSFEPGFRKDDAKDCLALIDALGIECAHLLAHSIGGTIALMLAASDPARVMKCVVVAAHIYFEPKMISGPNAIVEAAKIPPLRLVLAREHGERALALVEAWVEHWRHSDPSALDLRAELGRTSTPSLVIQGELDEHATPQHARDLAAGVRTSQLWLIEDVYHMPPHEIPERFNRRVMDFIFTDQHEGSMEQHRGSDV